MNQIADNPLIALQDNLAALLAAHPYFNDAEQTPILTEKLADLEAHIDAKIMQAGGFGVVITTAKGDRLGSPDDTELTAAILTEELTVTIIHLPLLDTRQRRALDAVFAAIQAVDTQPSSQPLQTWRVLGHFYIENSADGVVTHHIRVSTKCIF